jgi:hypothetical protein
MNYSSCDFPLKNVQEVSNLVACKIKKRKPFSLIRLGDGEGLLLSISSQSTESDLKYLAQHLGPQSIELGYLLHLRDCLINSINNSDLMGVRDDIIDVSFSPDSFSMSRAEFMENFQKRFKLREIDESLDYHGARRIALLHKSLCGLALHDDIQFCSAWLNYEFHNSGEIFKILKSQERIGLISCRTKLPHLLERLFSVHVKFYQVPAMFNQYNPTKTNAPTDYVERFEKILSQKLVECPGMLYLVGAGLYGKLYCELIKSQGGIALDLGSLFDAWLGIPSRPSVYRSMFGMDANKTGVPSRLSLSTDNVSHLLQTVSK